MQQLTQVATLVAVACLPFVGAIFVLALILIVSAASEVGKRLP